MKKYIVTAYWDMLEKYSCRLLKLRTRLTLSLFHNAKSNMNILDAMRANRHSFSLYK